MKNENKTENKTNIKMDPVCLYMLGAIAVIAFMGLLMNKSRDCGGCCSSEYRREQAQKQDSIQRAIQAQKAFWYQKVIRSK